MSALSRVLRRTRRFSIASIQTGLETQCCGKDDKIRRTLGYSAQSHPILLRSSSILVFFDGRRELSSNVDPRKYGEEHDLEDGFSELETNSTSAQDTGSMLDNDELLSEPDLSGDEESTEETPENELDQLDYESGLSEKKPATQRSSLELFKSIRAAPSLSVGSHLDKWVEEGKDLKTSEIFIALFRLRRHRMYGRALQLLEWLEANKKLEFAEKDYASRLDLIAKVRGMQKAENYLEKIPKSFRGELVYRTLLANYVSMSNVKKAEEVFNRMKDLGFPISSFACNQLLLLYKRIDKKKIADVLLLMEKEDVKPTLFTFKTLIDAKGSSRDITSMDQIVESMKAEGIEPDVQTQAIIAKHYASAGLKEKAETVLKEMEGESLKVNRQALSSLLFIYGEMGRADQVERLWKECEVNPRVEECEAAIKAFGQLKRIEEAEKVFESMSRKWTRLSSKNYSCLLKVYTDNKMLLKGKELVKRMADSGCKIGPLIWDELVKLHLEAGEVDKADLILNKVNQNNRMKPMFRSYQAIMEEYSKKGDVHNSEKIFHRMRQAGYVSRLGQFQLLVQAYVNAKTPAYGMRERMKADNVFPNKALAAELVKVDAFRKNAVSDLLD